MQLEKIAVYTIYNRIGMYEYIVFFFHVSGHWSGYLSLEVVGRIHYTLVFITLIFLSHDIGCGHKDKRRPCNKLNNDIPESPCSAKAKRRFV